MLEPSAARVVEIDHRLRGRLSDSLEYLASFLPDAPAASPSVQAGMRARLAAGAVSPWVFGAYAMIVQALSRGDTPAAGRSFAVLQQALDLPAEAPPVAFLDPSVPDTCWEIANVLYDTDAARPFRPRSATEGEYVAGVAEIDAAMSVLLRASPESHAEVQSLQRMLMLGRPASDRPADGFGSASTFFLWGAALMNAAERRNVGLMLDTLVHETSHMLLFGLVDGGALSLNDPAARYSSPLRSDPRPIDGIFHACFVATRVHLVLERCLASGALPDELRSSIADRAKANAAAARISVDLLQKELRPTPAGASILHALTDYWQAADLANA